MVQKRQSTNPKVLVFRSILSWILLLQRRRLVQLQTGSTQCGSSPCTISHLGAAGLRLPGRVAHTARARHCSIRRAACLLLRCRLRVLPHGCGMPWGPRCTCCPADGRRRRRCRRFASRGRSRQRARPLLQLVVVLNAAGLAQHGAAMFAPPLGRLRGAAADARLRQETKSRT